MAAVTRGLLHSSLTRRYALEPITTHRVGAPLKGVPTFALALVRLMHWSLRNHGGIVHVHSAVRGSLYRKGIVVVAMRARGHPVVLHVHAGPPNIDEFVGRRRPIELAAFRMVFRRATHVVAVSDASARHLARAFGRDDIAVIRNAAPRVEPVGSPPAGPTVQVLYLGGFQDPAKGGEVLLRALPLLLDCQGIPPLRIVLGGPGEPPATLERGKGPVSWVGWLDETAKRDAFAAADIVVLPSISEGLPGILLEAMCHGRAIVATNVGGMPEIATDGYAASIVASGDPHTIACAIARLASDGELRRRLGDGARSAVAALDEDRVIEQIDELYHELSAR